MADIDFDSYIGMSTGTGVITVERGHVSSFATAVLDANPVYRDLDAATAAGFDGVAAPPTYSFAIKAGPGAYPEEQPEDATGGRNPMMEVMGSLMANGGLILHGEQAFEYHRPLVAGKKLQYSGVVKDIYQKPTGDKMMTFLVIEDSFSDEDGNAVVTATMNLIHRS